jgi:ribosome maturation factor RimP
MIIKDKILGLIKDILEEKNVFVVALDISVTNKISLVVDSMKGVGLDDCILFSKAIESGLDREVEDFELEVSSAGLGIPFKVFQQYLKNIGQEVEVVLKSGIKLTGKLLSANDSVIGIEEHRLVKIKGKKKKQLLIEERSFTFDELSKVYNVI